MNVKGEESQALQQGVTLIFSFFFFFFVETDAPIASPYHNYSMGDSLFFFCDTQTSRDNLLAPLFSVSLIKPAYLPADTQ